MKIENRDMTEKEILIEQLKRLKLCQKQKIQTTIKCKSYCSLPRRRAFHHYRIVALVNYKLKYYDT